MRSFKSCYLEYIKSYEFYIILEKQKGVIHNFQVSSFGKIMFSINNLNNTVLHFVFSCFRHKQSKKTTDTKIHLLETLQKKTTMNRKTNALSF